MQRRELPYIEKRWREFREDHVEDLDLITNQFKRNIKKSIDKFSELDGGTINSQLNYCSLPMHVAYGLLMEHYKEKPFVKYDKKKEEINKIVYLYAEAFSFFANYRRTKVIWNLDKDFIESVSDLPFPDNVPVNALCYLPNDTIVVPIPRKINDEGDNLDVYFLCWYDFELTESGSSELRLRIGMYLNGGAFSDKAHRDFMPIKEGFMGSLCSINLTENKTINDVWMKAIEDEGRSLSATYLKDDLRMLLNSLLYASGCDDIIKVIGHQYPSPVKKIIRRQPKPETVKKDFVEPNEYTVGVKFGSAIRQYKTEMQKHQYDGLPTGRTVRPHIRRAHSHLFWAGSDRRIPRVRFLPPIPVKMTEEQPEQPSVLMRSVS